MHKQTDTRQKNHSAAPKESLPDAPLPKPLGPHPNILLALGWYYPDMHHGVARFAKNHAWHILDDLVPVNWKGDGVLTLLTAKEELWERLRELKVSVVDLAESRPELNVPRAVVENAAAGRLAAEYFLNRGYRHFAFIAGSRRQPATRKTLSRSIAQMTGFETPHHLCHIFRKMVGLTPKQYRLTHRRK